MLIQPCSSGKLELKSSLYCQLLRTSQEPSTTRGIVELLISGSMLNSKEEGNEIIKADGMGFCGKKYSKMYASQCHLSPQSFLSCCSRPNRVLGFLHNRMSPSSPKTALSGLRPAHLSFICLLIPCEPLFYSGDLFVLSNPHKGILRAVPSYLFPRVTGIVVGRFSKYF